LLNLLRGFIALTEAREAKEGHGLSFVGEDETNFFDTHQAKHLQSRSGMPAEHRAFLASLFAIILSSWAIHKAQ
jgi:hypothetical protein